jgi:aminotransferase
MDRQTSRLARALARRMRPGDTSYRQRLVERAAKLEDVILMGLGDPDAPTPAHAAEAGRRAIAEGRTKYTHPAGLPELRAAIAALMARDYGLDYGADEVLVTAGTQEAVMLAMLALVEPGDEVLLPQPRFTSYDTALDLVGGTAVPVPTREAEGFALDPAAIAARITARTKAIVLVSPNNPTGAVTPPDALRRIAGIARDRDLVVVSDELYAPLLFDGAEHLSIATLPGMKARTITINGFSKSHAMTGWRIGWLAAPGDVVDRLVEPRHSLSINAATPSQHAALAAATGPRAAVEEIRATYAARREILLPGLESLGFACGRPGGAVYVYANVSASGLPATVFCERLLEEARVMVQPGMLFADPDDRHVRFSVLQPEHRIAEAIDRMRAARDRVFAR